ncbi:MAG: CopG family transcriptional regulator [Bacteroidota bacterium]
MLNVRLSKEMEEKLNRYSELSDMSKTSVVKEALAQYFSRKESLSRPYELGGDLFGQEGSGATDNSSTYKLKLKKKLNEKHSR